MLIPTRTTHHARTNYFLLSVRRAHLEAVGAGCEERLAEAETELRRLEQLREEKPEEGKDGRECNLHQKVGDICCGSLCVLPSVWPTQLILQAIHCLLCVVSFLLYVAGAWCVPHSVYLRCTRPAALPLLSVHSKSH